MLIITSIVIETIIIKIITIFKKNKKQKTKNTQVQALYSLSCHTYTVPIYANAAPRLLAFAKFSSTCFVGILQHQTALWTRVPSEEF